MVSETLQWVQILNHCDENFQRVSSLQILTKFVQNPQSELWTSTDGDKYRSLPEYNFGHYPPSEADYPYSHISNLNADFFITQK